MGGEQTAVLVFGPKVAFDTVTLMRLFNIVNVAEFASANRTVEEEEEESYSDEDIFAELYEVNYEDLEKLDSFLSNNKLSIVHSDNCDWETCYIGYIVKDFDKITEYEKKKVQEFCETYQFSKPTYYAGIIGEYE